MSDFLEENKTLFVILSLAIIAISAFFLIKTLFFYSSPQGEKVIIRPADEQITNPIR